MENKASHPRRELSRNKVLNSLRKFPKRSKELLKDTGLSVAGFNEIRKILLDEKLIDHTLINGKEGYTITKKGITTLKNYPYLAYLIDNIHSRDGRYHSDYTTTTGSILSLNLSWGIHSDLTYDKDMGKLNLLSPKDVIEIEKLLFDKISNNIKKKKLHKEQIGKMVLGFDINYIEVLKSIKEKSLAYCDNSFKEEWDLRLKESGDPEELTEKEQKKLSALQKKTYEKIKKLNL